jgi:hypothetical protein
MVGSVARTVKSSDPKGSNFDRPAQILEHEYCMPIVGMSSTGVEVERIANLKPDFLLAGISTLVRALQVAVYEQVV